MNTTPITINDDMLSAYLDGELPAQEFQAVRSALARDPVVAGRLEALKLANALAAQHAKALDATPLPAAVLAMLAADAGTQAATATILPGRWRRWRQHAPRHLALAASLVLILGVAVNYLNRPVPVGQSGDLPALAAYTDLLDKSPSGTLATVDGATLLNRFSFRNQQNQYCRQYQLRTGTASAENVACRNGQEWTLVASLPAPVQAATDAYQPAGGPLELNAVLDTMMQGEALGLATEAQLIERGWQDAVAE